MAERMLNSNKGRKNLLMHKNNFDFLRLVFAIFVIITHSYSISGVAENDLLSQISNGQVSFSYIGLKGFFIISGFLIFQSLIRSKSITDYLWKRVLRLFPALFVLLSLTLLLAPFVYENKAVPYLLNHDVWTYLPRNLLLWRFQGKIKGVFENNPFTSGINGSLWTLYFEFLFYIFLSVLFLFRKNELLIKVLSGSVFIFLLIGNMFFYDWLCQFGYSPFAGTKYLLDLGVSFFAGSALAAFNFNAKTLPSSMLYLILLLTVASLFVPYFHYVKYIALPLLIIGFGLKSTAYISSISEKIGDLSYGVYIYAFPIQQTLVYFFKLDYLSLMFFATLLSLLMGYLSWHLIEKRALALKNRPYTSFFN